MKRTLSYSLGRRQKNTVVGECSGMVGGEQHGRIVSGNVGALNVNRKETSWGRG